MQEKGQVCVRMCSTFKFRRMVREKVLKHRWLRLKLIFQSAMIVVESDVFGSVVLITIFPLSHPIF